MKIVFSKVMSKKIAAKHIQLLQTFKEVVEIKINTDRSILLNLKNNNIPKCHL